ncbi:hypothetical protein TNCV_2054691 [Trichonephila clavipes]|nr:hypothetical protein TNCV_2054691 [Trichonephila clavipes]
MYGVEESVSIQIQTEEYKHLLLMILAYNGRDCCFPAFETGDPLQEAKSPQTSPKIQAMPHSGFERELYSVTS